MASLFPLDPRVMRALSSSRRTAILRALGERAHTPAELARRLGVAEPTVQYHLDRLASAGLARRRDDGRRWAYHELTDEARAVVQSAGPVATATAAFSLLVAAALAWLWWDAQPDPLPPGTIGMQLPAPAWAPWVLAGAGLLFVVGLAVAAYAVAAWRARRSGL
jgi:DNA-binding transcriptional ArsR family regulator